MVARVENIGLVCSKLGVVDNRYLPVARMALSATKSWNLSQQLVPSNKREILYILV